MTPSEADNLAEAGPIRPDTYRAYLKAMYQFRQDTPEADWRGVEMLEEVVRRDSDSALAHTGLAFGYANIGHTLDPAPQDIYPRAKAAADIALQLDPNLAEAHQVVGTYNVGISRARNGH